LLHCYPYHREAAYLAAVYPNVHLDIGLGVGHLGPSAGTLVREAMELAPFGKLHYSSDAYGLAEFFLIGAMGFRAGLDAVLGDWVSSGAVAEADARAIAAQVLGSNRRGLYPIPAP
jgi:predicted TIM-barrel fold metal-dependent hydrolase